MTICLSSEKLPKIYQIAKNLPQVSSPLKAFTDFYFDSVKKHDVQGMERALMQYVVNKGLNQPAQADSGLCWPHTELMDNIAFVNEQRMSRSHCMYVHGYLDIGCSHIV